MKTRKPGSLTKYFGVFIPLFIIAGTILIYFISKGYKINISNGEIERTGILTFATIPRKATVYVDNKYIGRSPKAVSGLNEEIHSIKITKDGYYDWLMDIHVKAEQSIPIEPVLFLKEPKTEILFPEKNSNDTVIENLYFDPDGQMAVFTVVPDTEEEDTPPDTTKPKTLQIWAYTINKRFWEFEPHPRKIAEFTETTEDPLSLQYYNIAVSKNSQNVLFSTDSEKSQRHFILKTDIENQTPTELKDLTGYKGLSLTWSNDSQHLIFTVSGQLRSININSTVQTILDEKGKDETFIWTSDKNGLVYTVEDKEQSYTISRIHSNGENKTNIIDNIQKSSTRNLFEENQTEENGIEPDKTETSVIVTADSSDTDKASTLTEEHISIDTINEIRITDDSQNLMLLTNTQILLYTLDNNEIQRIQTRLPRYIAATETNHKFIFLSGDNQLIEYTSKVDDGDPFHKVGSKPLMTLDQGLSYTKCRWYPEYSNIICSISTTNKSDTEDPNSKTETTDKTNSEMNKTIHNTLHVMNTDSRQTFNIFDDADSPVFAIGNSGKYIVTVCNGMKLCKVTINE